LSLGNLGLETLVVMLAGFLVGFIPAFVFIGFYFGRRLEKEKKALQLSYERQLNALRDTLRRMMDKIDELTGERTRLQRSNKALREAVRDQHEITDSTNMELEDAQQNLVRLEERVDELEAENLRYEGRLEEAATQQARMADQYQQAVNQFTQTERLQKNLIFAASQLREAKLANAAFEAQLAQLLKPAADKESPDQEKLDVGVIGGMDPVYAERLHESGIHTIGDLAKQTPARVAHFVGLPDWDDSAAWIAEAKLRLAGANPRA
jgi:predicted flap endonuclease-1-like 5' DNA nuclease